MLSQSGSRLSRSEGPWSRVHQRTWWMRHDSNGTVHPGWPQVRCIARNARRCLRLTVRWARPESSTSPEPPSTVGYTTASHSMRRNDAAAKAWPSLVSHSPWVQQSSSNRSSVVTTQISGTLQSASRRSVTPSRMGGRPQIAHQRDRHRVPDRASIATGAAGPDTGAMVRMNASTSTCRHVMPAGGTLGAQAVEVGVERSS